MTGWQDAKESQDGVIEAIRREYAAGEAINGSARKHGAHRECTPKGHLVYQHFDETRNPSTAADASLGSMPNQLTVDEIVPLIAALAPEERERLLRLFAKPQGDDASRYCAMPPANGEFSADMELLAWDGEGWENVA